MKRIISSVLAFIMTFAVVSSLIVTPIYSEDDETVYNNVIIDESFDDYQADVGTNQTKLDGKFTSEANAIGESSIKVCEEESGNLFLRSRVFTQVYITEPIEEKYTFSLDVVKMDGSQCAGIFVRAPKNDSAYYEGDSDPAYDRSLSKTGMLFYVENSRIGINIKTYSKSSPYTTNNTVYVKYSDYGLSFDGNQAIPLRIDDDGETVSVYIADTLVAYAVFTNANKVYKKMSVKEKCFETGALYDGKGNLLGEYTNTLVQGTASIVGWATRVATIDLDNIYLATASESQGGDEQVDVDSLPDNCPGTKPAIQHDITNRKYPWLEIKGTEYKYDFSSDDIKTYSNDEKLATASLRTGMSFADGKLSCVEGKTFAFGSAVFLGDDYGIAGGELNFDMSLTGGRTSVGIRLEKTAANNSKRGIWFSFGDGKLTVSEPESGLRYTMNYDASSNQKYKIYDQIDRITLISNDKTVLYLTYETGGAIHIYTYDGKWLAGVNSSNVNPAGYFSIYANKSIGYIDNLSFNHAEITDSTALSGERILDYSTWTATDDRDRTVTSAESAGEVREDKSVGLFYFISWTGTDNENILDNTALYLKLGAEGLKQYFEAGQNGAYYWAEPYFGYYKNSDTWIYRKHAYMLEAAGVDFIYVDLTNGAHYPEALTSLFDTWLEMRKEGNMTPEIVVFAGNASASVNASLDGVRGSVYSDVNWDKYSQLFYEYEGKPLIMVGTDEGLTDTNNNFLEKFTVRPCWAWQDRDGWWSWIQEYVNKPDGSVEYVNGGSGTLIEGKPEALALMLGHHATTNKGRSYANGQYPDTSAEDFGFSLDSGAGIGFAAQWEAVKKLDPKIILLCGWNEWTAGVNYNNSSESFSYMGGTHVNGYGFVDQFNTEYSRDAEPMKIRDGEGSVGFGDNYYYQMCSVIREFKGMTAEAKATGAKTVDIRDTADWDNVGPEYLDSVGDTQLRSEAGYFTGIVNVNNSGRNDFDYAKVSQDSKYLYFTVKCVNDIIADSGVNWMNLFININGNATDGWEGYDYVINRARDKYYVSVESLANGWGGAHIGQALYTLNGKYMTVRLDKSVIGIDGEITSFTFKWADNSTTTGNVMEFMDLGDTAPNDRFAYIYNGNQSSTTEDVKYVLYDEEEQTMKLRNENERLPGTPESETETEFEETTATVIETQTDIETTASDNTTEKSEETAEAEDKKTGCAGCGGIVGIQTAVFMIPAVVITFKRKKEN